MQPGFSATSVAPVTRPMRWRTRPPEQTVPISTQAMRGSGGPFPWASAQTERVQDWPSLDQHEYLRVNLADHAANTTCPSLARPGISGRTRTFGCLGRRDARRRIGAHSAAAGPIRVFVLHSWTARVSPCQSGRRWPGQTPAPPQSGRQASGSPGAVLIVPAPRRTTRFCLHV